MDKIKVGFVGCGFMGQLAHLANFVEIDKCEIVAIAELREELGKLVAEKYHIPKVYKSHRELAKDDEIEAVVAILPRALTPSVSLDLLEAGKHVFIEKPMASSVSEAKQMVETAEKNKRKLMVGYMKRYDPGVEKAKELTDNMKETLEFGRIIFANAHLFGGGYEAGITGAITTDEPYPELPDSKIPDWLPQKEKNKFLSVLNVWSHDINLLRFLLGNDVQVDYADFSKGKEFLIVLNFGEFKATLEGASADYNWDEKIKIYYEKGWIEIFTPPPLLRNVPAKVEIYKKEETIHLHVPWGWSFKRQAEHFIDCIMNDKEPRTSGRDSILDVDLVEKAFKKYLNII